MLAQILALFAAAAPAAPPEAPANTVSPLTVNAPSSAKPPPADEKLTMQGSSDDPDQLVAIWPGTAYQVGLDGHVSLNCLIDLHGLAERCQVVEETPAGRGFGAAALEIRPTIKIAPPKGPDGPVAGYKILAVTFKAPERRAGGADVQEAIKSKDYFLLGFDKQNGMKMRKVTMLDAPVWASAANFDDLAAAYPDKGGGAEGYAVDHCQVQPSGVLFNCQTIKEEPEERGFGRAAVRLALRFKVSPQLARARHRDELWVDIPIRMPPPAENAARTVMSPIWLVTFDPAATPKLFPPEAVASGLTTGRGVARCTVGADGALTACVPESGDPDGLGFSEAAAKLASTMKMNLWSADAAPVEGGVVRIPIRLNLKATGG
jgi:hypothetical protein